VSSADRPSPPSKPVHRRLLGPVAAALGVHDFLMLYGEADLEGPFPEVVTRIPFDVSLATRDEIEGLLPLVPPEQQRACRSSARFDSTCVVARHDGRFAGYSWYHPTLLSVLHLPIETLPPGIGYTFASYVLPEFRGKKLFQCLTRAVWEHARDDGRSFICNLVERRNAASIAARKRLGVSFQPVRIVALPLLGARFVGRRPTMGGPRE
jgi:GNAT superfamily N-acetyltransferase